MFRLLLALVFGGALLCAASPGLAAAQAPSTETYGKLPGVEHVTLSPSGKQVAMIGVVGETRRLIVGPVGGGIEIAAGLGNIKVRAVDWAGEDHLLVTISQTAKLGMDFSVDQAELTGVLVVAVPSGKVFSVFDKRNDVANIVQGTFGARQIGGHWYGFFGGIAMGRTSDPQQPYLDHTYPDLYRVDLDTGDFRHEVEGSPDNDGWLVGVNGEVVARASYEEDRSGWKVLVGGRGRKALAIGKSPFGGVSLSYGRTSDKLLMRRGSDNGTVDEEIPLAGGAPVEVPDDDAINYLYFDRVTDLWIGYSTFGDVPTVKMFNPLIDKRVAAARKAFPGLTVRLDSWSTDFTRMVVFTTGGDDSGTYWIVDITTGKADPIGYEYPTVHSDQVGPIRMVQWKAQDGTEIHGVLSLPPGREAKNLPVVVLPHGGPESRDHPVFDWWAQAFASRGYAVLQPNFRGSSGYSQEFRDAGFGQWGRKMQTDVSDGLLDLAKQGVVDPRRACIVGASYGGYAALAGVTLQHGIYRCAVSVAGVSNPAGMIDYARVQTGGSNSATRYWQKFMGGSGLDQISPVRQASHADAPILLIHGKDDTVVPFDQSTQMQRALMAANKPVEMVVMPAEDHYLSREVTRTLMLTSAVAFVEKYNPVGQAN